MEARWAWRLRRSPSPGAASEGRTWSSPPRVREPEAKPTKFSFSSARRLRLRWLARNHRVRTERERYLSVSSEDSRIVRQLRQRGRPLPARLDLLRPRIGQGCLRRQKVENASDTLPVAARRNLFRLLGAGKKLVRSRDALFRNLK